MKTIVLLLALCASSAYAQLLGTESSVTNLESGTVTTKGWRRYYVFQDGNGEMIDPTTALSSFSKIRTLEYTIGDITNVANAAFAGMNTALQRLWTLTNDIPTVGCSVRFNMQPDRTRTNLWAYIAKEVTDGTNDTAWVWFSQSLNCPMKMSRRYYGEEETMFVDAVWPDGVDSPVNTNGFNGCHRITYARPSFAQGILLVYDPYVEFGHPVNGLSFGSALVTVNGRDTLTGIKTNRTWTATGTNFTETITFSNGIINGVDTIKETP